MSARNKVYVSMVIICILLIVGSFLFLGCGSQEEYNVIVDDGGTDEQIDKISFEEAKANCFKSGCHNGNAPALPLDEASFKASKKIRKEVEDGDMPPKGFSAENKAKFLKFLDGEQQ